MPQCQAPGHGVRLERNFSIRPFPFQVGPWIGRSVNAGALLTLIVVVVVYRTISIRAASLGMKMRADSIGVADVVSVVDVDAARLSGWKASKRAGHLEHRCIVLFSLQREEAVDLARVKRAFISRKLLPFPRHKGIIVLVRKGSVQRG